MRGKVAGFRPGDEVGACVAKPTRVCGLARRSWQPVGANSKKTWVTIRKKIKLFVKDMYEQFQKKDDSFLKNYVDVIVHELEEKRNE